LVIKFVSSDNIAEMHSFFAEILQAYC